MKNRWIHNPESWRDGRYTITHLETGFVGFYELTPGGAYVEHLGCHSTFEIAKAACQRHKKKNAAWLRKQKPAGP